MRSKRVERSELEAFLAKTRADEAPDFQVRPSGDAPDLLVVEFVEPAASNGAAMGVDIGSDPVRRAGAERARPRPALSSWIIVRRSGQPARARRPGVSAGRRLRPC